MRRAGLAIVGVAAVAIAVATLTPGSPGPNAATYDPRCAICGPVTGVDIIGNLLLFIPLGIGLAVAAVRRRTAVAAGAALSLIVEVLQLVVVPGRDASIVDLAANTLGTLIGFAAGTQWRMLLWPSKGASGALALGSGVGYLAMVAAVCWALGPGLSEPPWYLERGIGTRLRPSGQVLDARAANEPMRGDFMTNVPTVRSALLAGGQVSVTAAVAPGPNQTTSLIQVLDTTLDNVVTIDRRGDDAAFFSRMRAGGLRLQRIGVRLPGFFASSAGDTVRLTGARVGARLDIAGERNGQTMSRSLLLTPAVGWALFVPVRGGLGASATYPGLLWSFVLLLPFAYWAAQAHRHDPGGVRWHLTRIVVGVLAAAAVPRAVGIGGAQWWEWVAAACALIVGHLVASMTRTHGGGHDYLSAPSGTRPTPFDRPDSSIGR